MHPKYTPISMPALLYTMGVLRAAAGGLTLVSPGLSTSLFGLGSGVDEVSGAVMAGRLFGVRDLVLGAALLHVTDSHTLRTLLQMGLIIDSVDVLSYLVTQATSDATSKTRAPFGLTAHVTVAGGAAAFVAIGAYLLRQ